jgi:predicted DNA-binding protein
MPKIDISFKKTSRDMRLYLEVSTKEEKSDFVKDAIEHYIKHLEEKQIKKEG